VLVQPPIFILQEADLDYPHITLDFETYYDKDFSLGKLTTVEYVNDPRFKVWGVGIKFGSAPTEWFSEDITRDIIEGIDWENNALICHNIMFDGYILTRHFNVKPKFYIDTAAISRSLWPHESASLKALATRLWPNDEKMRKGEELITCMGVEDLSPKQDEIIGNYCIQDVDLTYAAYQKFVDGFPEEELKIIDMTARMFTEPVLHVDMDKLKAFHESEINQALELIENSGTTREVLASNQKFTAFIETLGITAPLKVSPTTGNMIPAFSKNDKAFHQLQKMYPEHKNLWGARIAVKSRIAETRAKRFIGATHADGTISVPLKYYGAHTGRFSGEQKINFQNLPRGSVLRRCLIAPDGHLIYVADLSNIEARMTAHLAKEVSLLKQFKDNVDVYSNFASKIYNRPINKKDDPIERFVGKTAVLGLGYGMGYARLKDTLASGAGGSEIVEISEAEAQNIVTTYRVTYSHIPHLWRNLENILAERLSDPWPYFFRNSLTFKKGEIILPNGMSIKYPHLRIENGGLAYDTRRGIERTWGGRITENVIQAMSRIIITDSMIRIQETMPEAKIALTVHDEIVIVGPDTNPDSLMEQIINLMVGTAPDWCKDIPLDAEGGYDISYSK
tara:strand:+ start:6939 stop:8801 length:1863 start_codon:yes stop_codon:yes gene_type:complete